MKYESELKNVTPENWPDKFDYFFVSTGKKKNIGHFATPTNIKLFICEVLKKQLVALK